MVAQNNSGNGNNSSIINITVIIATLYITHNIILVICWQHNVIMNNYYE